MVWWVISVVCFLCGISVFLGVINPNYLNKNLKSEQKPITRKSALVSSMLLFIIGLGSLSFTHKNIEPQSAIKHDQKAQENKNNKQNEKEGLLPADPKETELLRVHEKFLKDTYNKISAVYNQQKVNYNQIEWAEFVKQIREQLDQQNKKFKEQFPGTGKVSGGNVENVFTINEIYLKINVDYLKMLWDSLEGKSNPNQQVNSDIDQLFNKLTLK